MKPNFLYIFFENHKKNGFIKSFFAKQVIKYDKKTKRKHKVDYPVVNHIGFLFYHQNQFLIAELDYFCGGKIFKKKNQIEI
jgi:hypothetical protein